MDDPRLVLEMFAESSKKKATEQALEIPAKELNKTIQLLRLQADAIAEYESISHVQSSRLRFKIMKELETRVDNGMMETDELLRFMSSLNKTSEANQREVGGLAEHLEEMFKDTKETIANKMIEKAHKFEELERNTLDITPRDSNLPNI